ncbi:ATP-dependent helicase [Bartonella sp. DGB1]|uniref:ATP-dependent helicase n=1 Tax=Bartonella sp. DGB1 TaxID=3239807 RepID=UPI0035264F51
MHDDNISYDFSYLSSLNEEQKLAVTTTEGPLLVLSGAGTGKTRVLTSRIAYILQNNLAQPHEIFAVTFTNKAANEMKSRVQHMLSHANSDLYWMGTFHSLGVKILRKNAELLGLHSSFTILDKSDSLKLLKQIFTDKNIDSKYWKVKSFAELLDDWKNRALLPEDVPPSEANLFANGKAIELYAEYQDRLKIFNSCDFGDLLLYPIEIFKKFPLILEKYQQRFKYFLVDEYQDTNISQYQLLKLLSKKENNALINLCCVGDEDQSIYGWRGASISNILRFDQDFPGAKIIRLEKNYRSTKHILGAASHLIAHNKNRLGKNLYAAIDANNINVPLVNVYFTQDSQDEARTIAKEIEKLHKEGHPLKEIAILVRATFQMREIEEYFITRSIAYRIIGGTKFYERLEIKDALAYLRLTINSNDDLAFERIINTPKRGLGAKSLSKIYDYARLKNISLFAAAEKLTYSDELSKQAKSALTIFIENFLRWQKELNHFSPADLAKIILDESGYSAIYKMDSSDEAKERTENLKELVNSLSSYDNLYEYLEHISLTLDRDNNIDTQDTVNLMTLHASKGLEFSTVFLTGWEEGIFPHERILSSSQSSALLEEERRLAYVGITRAKINLHIFSVKYRRIHGRHQPSQPSRFLQELPIEHINKITSLSQYNGYNSFSFNHNKLPNGYPTPGWQRAALAKSAKLLNSSPQFENKTIPAKQFIIGERVFHLKFGSGTILKIYDDNLIINFDKAGEKNVLTNYVTPL